MSRDAMRELREIMRGEFQNFFRNDQRARVSDVVALVRSDHPQLVARLTSDLEAKALHRIAMEVVKTWSAVADKGDRQLELPDFVVDVAQKLPAVISIPLDAAKQDIDMVPATIATPAHWRGHLEYLRDQHSAIGNVIRAIVDLLEGAADCPEDRPVYRWLGERAST